MALTAERMALTDEELIKWHRATNPRTRDIVNLRIAEDYESNPGWWVVSIIFTIHAMEWRYCETAQKAMEFIEEVFIWA